MENDSETLENLTAQPSLASEIGRTVAINAAGVLTTFALMALLGKALEKYQARHVKNYTKNYRK